MSFMLTGFGCCRVLRRGGNATTNADRTIHALVCFFMAVLKARKPCNFQLSTFYLQLTVAVCVDARMT